MYFKSTESIAVILDDDPIDSHDVISNCHKFIMKIEQLAKEEKNIYMLMNKCLPSGGSLYLPTIYYYLFVASLIKHLFKNILGMYVTYLLR